MLYISLLLINKIIIVLSLKKEKINNKKKFCLIKTFNKKSLFADEFDVFYSYGLSASVCCCLDDFFS